MSGGLDLFGEPIALGRGGSRRRHVPTAAQRARVKAMLAEGQKQPAIAAALGMSLETLYALYRDEMAGWCRRGRPRHVPTPETRQRVQMLRESGATLLSISAALKISEPTLVLHYGDQLGCRRRRMVAAPAGLVEAGEQ